MNNNNSNNFENTSLIKIESLEKEYQVTLTQYEQVYQTYLNNLQQDEQVGISNYNTISTIGSCNSSGSVGDDVFPANGLTYNNIGNYPGDQCANLCDENPFCAGYNLLGPNDSNGNPSCQLFTSPNASLSNDTSSFGCYKKKSFVPPSLNISSSLLGVGTDGMDYFKPSLTDPWQRLQNDTGGDLIACAVNPSNNMFFVVNKQFNAAFKNSYTEKSFTGLPNSCCIIDLAISPDGQYVVVIDKNDQLWSGELSAFTNQDPTGIIIGNVNKVELFTAANYEGTMGSYTAGSYGADVEYNGVIIPNDTVSSMKVPQGMSIVFDAYNANIGQMWTFGPGDYPDFSQMPYNGTTININDTATTWDVYNTGPTSGLSPANNPNQFEGSTAVAISPQGMVFTVGGNQIYTKSSYQNLSSELWQGPLPNSCCVTSISFAADGTLIGVGTDNQLYSKPPDNGYTNPWTNINVANDPVKVISIATISITTNDIPTQVKISNNNATAEFIALQGKNYWGTTALKEGEVTSLQDCETMCASDMNCTGATFLSDKNYCYTRSGESSLTNGADTDYALIPQIRQNLITIKQLNLKLLEINRQISAEIQKLYPIAKQDQAEKNEKQRELNENYAKLLMEKEIIDKNLQEYVTIEQEYENNTLMVDQQSILLKFWSIFALVILAITLKIIFKIKGSSFLFLFITVFLIAIFLSMDWWSIIPIVLLPLLFKLIYYPS